jgi:hypothetical protein
MFDQIVSVICEGEKISFESLLGENRKEEIVYARQLIMYFAKEKKTGSLAFIGSKFGKDHATVLHSVKSIKNYIDTDKDKCFRIKEYEKKIEKCKAIISVKADLEKIIDPLQKEVSKLEQRLIFCRLTIDKLMKEIKTL